MNDNNKNKNENHLKNEDNLKRPQNEDDHKNENDLKNEDGLKNILLPPPLPLKNYLIFFLLTSHRDCHTTTDVKPEMIPVF